MGFLVLLKKHLYIYIITLYTDMAKSLLKACTFSCLWSFPRVLFLSFYLSASSIVHFITPALHPVITFSKFCIIGNTNAQGLASVFKSKSSVVLTTRPQCWFYLQLKKILLSLWLGTYLGGGGDYFDWLINWEVFSSLWSLSDHTPIGNLQLVATTTMEPSSASSSFSSSDWMTQGVTSKGRRPMIGSVGTNPGLNLPIGMAFSRR